MRLYKLTLKMSELISSEFLKKKALIISELSFFWWTWRDCFFDRNCFDAIAYIIVYQYYTK